MIAILLPALALGVAWATIVIQVTVVPYWNKHNDIYKDFHASGALSLARSGIESNKVIPRLAGMFRRAINTKSQDSSSEEIAELLQQIDFIDDLDALESAIRELTEIRCIPQELKIKANRIGTFGIFHSVFSLVFPISFISSIPMWHWIWPCIASLLWITSLSLLGSNLYSYRRRNAILIDRLEVNQGGANG